MLRRFVVVATAWLLAAVSAVPGTGRAADVEAAVPGAALARQRAAEGGGKVSVIVRLRQPAGAAKRASAEAEAAEVARAQDDVRRSAAAVGVPEVRPIGKSPFAAMEVDRRQLDALVASGLVSSVEVNAKAKRHLGQSVPLVRAPQAWAAGARGAGQVVVVIDDGVDDTHPFLAGRVVAGACAAPDCGNDASTHHATGAGRPCGEFCTHGTHVAGVVAGSSSGRKGVAPAADIISIRVFSETEGTFEGIASALDYTRTELAKKFDIAAVNMSLGSDGERYSRHCDDDWPSMAYQIDGLRELGILTVVSTGNEYDKNRITAPACVESAVAVGATFDTPPEEVAGFSNSAPIVDLVAPGDTITSSVPGRRYADEFGTSFAAPHVAGAVAVLRSGQPRATADAIEAALKGTGKRVTDPANRRVSPRLDVAAALERLRGGGVGEPEWRAWVGLGGTLASPPECEPDGDAAIDCWARGTGNTLVWKRTNDGNTWSGWTNLGGSVASAPDCVARDGDRTDCFVTTGAKRLAQITRTGSSWGRWVDLGGAVAGRPSCVAGSGTALDCFAAGTDRALWRRSFAGGAWKPWERVGGSTTKPPECVARSAGIDCFIVDAGGTLRGRRLSGGRWGTWQALGGGFALPPHCLGAGTGLDCFAQGANGHLLQARYAGGAWGRWADRGGTLASQPYCDRRGDGFDCYAASPADKLVHRRSEGGIWAAWEDLGGRIEGRPSCLTADAGPRADCLARGVDGTLRERSYR